jgi:MSHA pilin protein MshC
MNNLGRRSTGFTLTELVVVIVIAGILSAVIYNRVSVSEFKVEGSTDELRSALRYAHKLAIAQRRNVFVSASGSDVSLCYVNGCGTRVTKPPTQDPFTVAASNTATLSSAFYFDSQGRPTLIGGVLATTAITLSLAGATRTITVEPQTGFVH